MLQVENIEQWKGQEVVGTEGERIGKLDEILFECRSGQPTLAVVKVGRLSKHQVLVPLAGATLGRDHVRLAHTKEMVEAAPRIDSVESVDRDDELLLARHYGVTAPPEADDAGEDESPRYETATMVEQRRSAIEADERRAAELEAEAERRQAVVVEGQTTAAQATERADEAEQERRRLLAEAAALREGNA